MREVGESVGEAIADGVGRMLGRTQEQRPLPADLLEDEETYLVVFDAPGVHPADVQVRYEDGVVHVRLDRFRDPAEGFEMRFPGRGLTLEGSKRLPPDAVVDPAAASASLGDNGTLTVRLPKAASATGDDGVSVEGADAAPDDE
jgi:HSP20 family molecular chaperone IbpA